MLINGAGFNIFGWLQLFVWQKHVIHHRTEVFNSAPFCPLPHLPLLPSPASSPAVILLFVREKPRAIQSDILPSSPPLPPHANACLPPVPDAQQPRTHPARARGPVSQQALLLLHLFFLVPTLLSRLLPGLLAQLPAVPLLLCKPCLPPVLTSPPLPAAFVTLPCSLDDDSITPLPHHGGSSDQLGPRSHPGVRGHGVSGHVASVRPLPLVSPPASADNGEPTYQQ